MTTYPVRGATPWDTLLFDWLTTALNADGTLDAANVAGIQPLIDAAVAALVGGAPGALDTLNELAAALGDDANFATTVTNALALKIAASTLTTDGDLLTRTAGVPARLTRAGLAADPALTGTYVQSAALAANTQRLMAKLTRNTADAAIVVLGDSTGDGTADWVYQMLPTLAARFPAYTVKYYLWDDGGSAYGAATTLQTGTGSYTLSLWNASVSGKNVVYHLAPNFDSMVAVKTPDLVIINHGHNEGASQTDDQWRGQYLALTETVSLRCPTAGLVCIAQNPATATPNDQSQRATVYAQVAAMRGYGFIDVHQAFVDTGDPGALTSDGTHPNTAGTALWVATVLPAFTYVAGAAARTEGPSSLSSTGEQLLSNGLFASFAGSVPDGWTANAGITTVTKDLTNYESANAYAVKVSQAGTAGYIYQDLPILRVVGQYVTIAARQYIPSGQASSAGRIGVIVTDGAATTTTLRANSNGQGGFKWAVMSIRVPITATRVRVILYCDSANVTANVTYDRVTCVVGVLPRHAFDATATAATASAITGNQAFLSNFGKEPALAWSASTSTTHGTANGAIATPFIPDVSMTCAVVQWNSGTVQAGNYDIGIYSVSGSTLTKLWSKGSTAWPAASTAIVETVSPTVELVAGTTYWVLFSSDGTTATWRGLAQSLTGQQLMRDGTAWGRIISTAFPLGTTHTLPATAATKAPLVQFRTA